MVIPRENIIEVARLAILQLLLVNADADGSRRRVDDNIIIKVGYSLRCASIGATQRPSPSVMLLRRAMVAVDDAFGSKNKNLPKSSSFEMPSSGIRDAILRSQTLNLCPLRPLWYVVRRSQQRRQVIVVAYTFICNIHLKSSVSW